MIISDSRESKCIQLLKSKKSNVKVEFLECGDYLLPDGYAIERKKGKDFVASIMDKRIYKQLNNLVQYDNPMIAIITDNIWRDFYFSKSKYIHSVYHGTLTTIVAKYPKVKILQFECDEDFVDFIVSLDKKLCDDEKHERPTPMMRKATSSQEIKENCLTAIPGVGIKMSKKLLKKFGSINNISKTKVDDLLEIEKLGKVVASRILEMLN